MSTATHKLSQRIEAFPGGQSEADWLKAFEFLRAALSDTLATRAQLGCYRIDDFPHDASAGGGASIRARTPVPGIDSDCWEGSLGWGGSRNSRARASALIFPFLNESAVQPAGRIADIGKAAEVDRFLLYEFENGAFVDYGWQCASGPGEWAHATVPDTIYCRDLAVQEPREAFQSDGPIHVDITIPELPALRSNLSNNARISLIHTNRNRERTNVAPWTANPPSNLTNAQAWSAASFPAPNVLRIRLDAFNIRGGWVPGKYHLSLRIQNFHSPLDWSWSAEISRPFKLTIV